MVSSINETPDANFTKCVVIKPPPGRAAISITFKVSPTTFTSA